MKKIAIIGGGNIGSRYVESLLNTEFAYELYIVDTSAQALKVLAEKVGENRGNITYLSEIEGLPASLDLAAVTTTSGGRRAVTEKLLTSADVKYLILEKPLFCKMDDYEIIETLLEEKHVKAWVNCTRRETASYQRLKSLLQEEAFEFVLSGSEWGMGCNATHYLDLICFLAGTDEMEVNADGLYNTILESKRKPYKEILGTITGNAGRCVHFSLTAHGRGTIPVLITIKTSKKVYLVSEAGQSLSIWEKDGSCDRTDFKLPYTSQAMGPIIEKIITTGNCLLADYAESAKIHKALQRPLTDFFEKMGGEKGICPIT